MSKRLKPMPDFTTEELEALEQSVLLLIEHGYGEEEEHNA